MKHLINDYYLDLDKLNYILVERTIKQSGKNKGKEDFNTIGYFSNLTSLKRGIIKKCIHDNFINNDLNELLHTIDKLILKMEGIK